jgi:predicted amidohydrolase
MFYIADGDRIVRYNSQCFVNRKGELIKTYRKAFLYETDELWASEGPGFDTIDIPELGKVLCVVRRMGEMKSMGFGELT